MTAGKLAEPIQIPLVEDDPGDVPSDGAARG